LPNRRVQRVHFAQNFQIGLVLVKDNDIAVPARFQSRDEVLAD
jgi:hypothetical protein